MQSKAVAVFCLLLALCLIGGVHAAKKDKGQRRGPQYDFSACGGAKACLGEAKLNQVLAKTGLNQHKTVDDLAQLLDTDDDLGFDTVNEWLVYGCSHMPDSNLPVSSSAAVAAQDAAVLPTAAAPQDAPAGGLRKLLSSSDHGHHHHGHHHEHHHHHHHHHHHRRALLKNAPAPAPAAPVQAGAEIASGWMPNAADTPITETQAFTLHSRPTATRKIYLDFNGHNTTGTAWNAGYGVDPIVSPAYDKDGQPNVWSAGELSDILAIWRAVSEDYSAFDVDVTTEDPGAALATSGTRVVIGGSGTAWYGAAAGGTAYAPAFGQAFYQPAFVFAVDLSNNAKHIWEACAHEAGHTFGLSHDGDTNGNAYYAGQGNWAPIMGSAYTKEVTQFSRGEYSSASNKEDDVQIIGKFLPLIAQEQGTTTTTATSLVMTQVGKNTTATPVGAVIRNPTDVDMWRFSTNAAVNVYVQVSAVSPWGNAGRSNLNATVTLTDTKTVLGKVTGVGSVLSVKVPKGNYYVSVTAAGSGDPAVDGYSTYGSRGQYQLSLTYA